MSAELAPEHPCPGPDEIFTDFTRHMRKSCSRTSYQAYVNLGSVLRPILVNARTAGLGFRKARQLYSGVCVGRLVPAVPFFHEIPPRRVLQSDLSIKQHHSVLL